MGVSAGSSACLGCLLALYRQRNQIYWQSDLISTMIIQVIKPLGF